MELQVAIETFTEVFSMGLGALCSYVMIIGMWFK